MHPAGGQTNRNGLDLGDLHFSLANSQKRVRWRIIGEQLTACIGHAKHIFVLHTEPSGNVNQRLEGSHHPRLYDLVAVSPHVRFLVQMEADAVSDKTDGLETQLAEFLQKLPVNIRATRPR